MFRCFKSNNLFCVFIVMNFYSFGSLSLVSQFLRDFLLSQFFQDTLVPTAFLRFRLCILFTLSFMFSINTISLFQSVINHSECFSSLSLFSRFSPFFSFQHFTFNVFLLMILPPYYFERVGIICISFSLSIYVVFCPYMQT